MLRNRRTKLKKIIISLMLASMASTLHAGLDDYLPPAKLKEHTDNLKMVYGGLGMTAKLVHLNAEMVTPYGIIYGKPGIFTGGEEPGMQVGYRYPYHFTGTDQNGYYFGVYGGHTANTEIDGKRELRLGGGVDLSYVLLNKQRISTLSVGVGASERVEGRRGSIKKTEPELQFAYSLSFGIF